MKAKVYFSVATEIELDERMILKGALNNDFSDLRESAMKEVEKKIKDSSLELGYFDTMELISEDEDINGYTVFSD